VDTGPGVYLNNSDIDSRRLQEAFFSPVSSEQPTVLPKKTYKKVGFWFLILPLALLVGLGIEAGRSYEFLILPKTINSEKPLQLLSDSNIASFAILGQGRRSAKINKSFLTLPLDNEKASGFEINFKTPVNLNSHDILLVLRNNSYPVLVSAIIKDSSFYSTANQPERIVVDPTEKELLAKVIFDLSREDLSKVNPSQVKQIKFHFKPYSSLQSKINIPVDSYKNQMIIVKEIALIKKEER
jgi:hypothetical protein